MTEHIPKKSLGQHWLHDIDVLQAIVAKAAIAPSDFVVEIGPGLGTLTSELLATDATVLAIEYDDLLIAGLQAKYANRPNFQLTHGDVLTFNFNTLPTNYKVVANIPYYLTSQLLRILSDVTNKPVSADLLMQKEVTERVCAVPGDMSILAVALQSEYTATMGEFVPAALFTPPPKVDSLILHLERRSQPLVPSEERSAFMRIVKAGFSAKRKTLRNTISSGLHVSKETSTHLLETTHIIPERRAETLSLEEWKALYSNCQEFIKA